MRDYEAYSGHVPVYIEPQTINAISMLRNALETVDFDGGDIDVTEIALALEDATLETPNGTLSVRSEDHQVVTPVVVSRVAEGAAYPVDDAFAVMHLMVAIDSCNMERPD